MINSILYSSQLSNNGTFAPLVENITSIPGYIGVNCDTSACVAVSHQDFEVIAVSRNLRFYITHSVYEQLADATDEESLYNKNPERFEFIVHNFILTADAKELPISIWDPVDAGTVENAKINKRIVLTGDLHQTGFAMDREVPFLYLIAKQLSITRSEKDLKNWFWKKIKDHSNSLKYGS